MIQNFTITQTHTQNRDLLQGDPLLDAITAEFHIQTHDFFHDAYFTVVH